MVRDPGGRVAFSDLRVSDGSLYCLGDYAGWPAEVPDGVAGRG